jgi:hypothetical protein
MRGFTAKRLIEDGLETSREAGLGEDFTKGRIDFEKTAVRVSDCGFQGNE